MNLDHDKNIRVGFALKNFSFRMENNRVFLIWVMLRAKASDFDYSTIPDLFKKWTRHFKERENGLNERSIIYWAKQDALEEYEKVKTNNVHYYINITVSTPFATEFDLAMVLYQMYKDRFVCSNRKQKIWMMFKNHHWMEDLGQSLRMKISTEMYQKYIDMQAYFVNQLQNYEKDDPAAEFLKNNVKHASTISVRLKKVSEKDNIFKDATDLFWDENFNLQRDTKKHLMCFSNGVVDFENNLFRDGYPQDYITKSTKIPYVPINPENEAMAGIVAQVTTFMSQLYPVPELNKYMWEHLASVLMGENINQTFNVYRGSGSNGKSMLIELMSHAFGDYKGVVPLGLVCDKRSSIGGTSSEIIQLKGIRYAVMSEPSKGMHVNEGVMKELTGGDPLQARALYCEAETFIPQFCLVVCTNVLFDINSNDDGTWRRIRLIPHMAKFVEDISQQEPDEENPYIFQKDIHLKTKLALMAPVFMSMLIQKAFITKGKVEDCSIVMASSNKYRQGQDHIAAFVSGMIIKKVGAKVQQRELIETFKQWFQEQQGSRKVPKGVELCEYMDKKFGKLRKEGFWSNIAIYYPNGDSHNVDKEDGEGDFEN